MADKMTKTTSSISLEETQPLNMTKMTSSHMPSKGEAQIVTRLAERITESYSTVAQKQLMFNDLTNQQPKRINNEDYNKARLLKPILKMPTDEWQEVCSSKNKLKRKKTLSTSLTSVTDSVNQEKRTRIEGMQLNCRGRLHIKENINTTAGPGLSSPNPPATPVPTRSDRLVGKPPLPPSTKYSNTESKVTVNPPPRLKRKLQENVQTIQKLNALTEQLRLELNELKTSLTTEKGAVRVLRAQNESEARKWKNEVKKLQNAVELLKKAGANKKCDATNTNNENLPQAAMGGLVNYEIQRLTNEINTLKEANKALEEKKLINCEADRRKAADIRELRDSYEIRLTQIQKSAKNEISRLLEEIKTKERNIGQLKKDLQILQNSKNTSRNATTNTNNQTNKTTNSNAKNQNNKKPKSSSSNDANKQNEESSKETESSKEITTTTKNKDLTKKVEDIDEVSKLKNIELINNTKNATTDQQKSTKILNTQYKNEKETKAKTKILENNNQNTITIIHKHLNTLEIPDLHASDSSDGCINMLHKTHAPLLVTTATQTTETLPKTTMTATATTQTPNITTMTSSIACDETDHFDEQHITQELTQHLENKAIQEAKENHHRHHHHHHHHHHHNNNSDSDSALSSAPTSISPQPPANGEEPTDLWQTMRSYAHDVENLQKEVDTLQKQNEQLKQELNLAKDQIIELETNAMENAKNTKIPQLVERIRYLEDQEHHLQAEANELREQNELLEFRILELEETNDKWSLQNHTNPTFDSSESTQTATVANGTKNLWSCPNVLNNNNSKPDPFEMLFGNNSHTNAQLDSGLISPQIQEHRDDLIDISNEELCRRLADLLRKSSLEEEERHCLQQVLNLVQQLDALTPRSGPNSLNATSSGDEASSLDLVKSRLSDYSSASSTSTSSARSICDKSSGNTTKLTNSNLSNLSAPPRIVATVQPYNSTSQNASLNTSLTSPRKVRCQPWQTNSLSESGVFLESDFYSDISENNVYTQTDFEDSGLSNSVNHIFNSPTKKLPVQQQNSSSLTDQKRLQYYKERVEILEGKLLIYESSGDAQAKRLAERLQREIQLEKEVNELRDRVEFLESENSTLEEEKCEFEEAENDTRLRLQRLEVELEILSQRNVELEMSREALSAKYKDCHSECLILRDDLATSETQIRHLEEDKQKAKENLEFLHNSLPLFLIYNTCSTLNQVYNQNCRDTNGETSDESMGNQSSDMNLINPPDRFSAGGCEEAFVKAKKPCTCREKELQYLKDEIKFLRHQIKELNARHYTAMESADSHWVDLEREYKEREEQFQAKEACLKQKIQKLQDCLKDDARSANEKICQLEESEQGLKICLVKLSKEHNKLQEDHEMLMEELHRYKEQNEQMTEQQRPLTEALENEKKHSKDLRVELAVIRKLQQEAERQAKIEIDRVHELMLDLKKDFLHIEVTNGELREEVATLELQIQNFEKAQKEYEEKIRCLTDEIRTKDEVCQKLEKRLERSEGYSLADELNNSPSKRFKHSDVKDLASASKGLGEALRLMEECEEMLPTQKHFKTVARDVKRLADTLLGDKSDNEKETSENENATDAGADETPTKTHENDNNFDVGADETQIETHEYENTINEDANETPNLTAENKDETQADGAAMETENAEEQPLEDRDSDVVEIKEDPIIINIEDSDQNIVVGMALIPEIHIDTNFLASCSQKKTICEVPSELRKLAEPTKALETELELESGKKTQQRSYRIKRGKRCSKRRMTRGRVSNLHLKVNRMVSRLFYDHKSDVFQDASEVDVDEPEVLQRNVSYGSFHSLREEESKDSVETNDFLVNKMDASVECEIKIDTKDSSTSTFIVKCDSSIQVNDEIAAELQIDSIPKNVRFFLDLLKFSNPNTKTRLNSSLFNMKICQRWEADWEFRQGLQILSTLKQSNIDNDTDTLNCDALQSYEDFVSVMNCLHILEEMFKPHKNEMLAQVEIEINELLMIFHNQKQESEFYCTVYYPVKRKSCLNLTKLLQT